MAVPTSPPRGHPMEPGKFPGPLYPPGAAPHYTPSGKTPFAKAVKRCMAHCGFWPWDPDSWDEAWSDAAAYGVEGNANKAGMKAMQRWSGTLDATGNVGEKTFNFLRSVLIPEGRDNVGKPAWDATCQALTEEANEQAQAPAKPSRQLAMDHMQRRLGYTESPSGSNCDNRSDGIRTSQDHCANGTWLRGQPWCGCWCFYALETAGVAKIDSHLASVAQIEDYARQGAKCYRGWTTDRSKVKSGDLVVIGGYGVHVEMVRGFDGGSNTLTYGGNTSSGSSGSQSNGGGAYARVRYPSEVRGYALVRYPGE